MKKLLHERLRNRTMIEQGCIGTDSGVTITALNKNEMLALADEIEKYYIPRPRFEDGEPVQFGDYVDGCNGPVDSFLIYEDGSGTVYGEADLPYKVDDGAVTHIDEPHKRPKPKILDADGVEINVGDTVWSLNDSTKWEVTETHPTEPRISLRQLDTEKEVEGGWFLSSEYSHREPDSLEKLLERMENYAKKNEGYAYGLEVRGFSDELRALIERGV